MPIGVPMAVPNRDWIRLPIMALSKPPCDPGAAVTCVKTRQVIASNPREKSVSRMEASKISPSAVAPMHRLRMMKSTRLRRRPSAAAMAGSLRGPAGRLVEIAKDMVQPFNRERSK